MEVGVGLPNAVPGTTAQQLTDWARRAERAGFSSLGTIDRIAYPNLDPMMALSAAAAVTERIGLATSILIGPMRHSPAIVAKQSASLQQLSGARHTLGIAVGGRADDYEATGADFSSRGAEFGGMADQIAASAAPDEGTAGDYVKAFEAAGCDELIVFPCNPDPEQVELLASAVL